MILTLPAGPQKLLLLDVDTLKRNTERTGRGSPAVHVVETDETGDTIHVGYNARTSSDAVVELVVFPRGHRFQKSYYAAWATTGEVVLDTEDGQVTAKSRAPAKTPKPARPATPKTPKVKH